MKKLALVAIVTMLGYVSAQAQSTRTTADDNKDGKKTYGVTTPANQPGVKKIENRSKSGNAKSKKTLMNGTQAKPGQAKPMGAKPHPAPFNHGKGKKHGHHKKHQNNGKHLGHYKHTTVATPSRGCNK